MPLDADLPLVIGMQVQPGAYAVLIGSGVSRASGMPGAWDVVSDLCKKVAESQGAEPSSDAIKWYEETVGVPPDYSSLLDAIAPTAAERSALLRPYFEPTEEERQNGLKQPTEAHKALAQLVANGWVRVVVTTNFDRLIEDALVTQNIRPVVIRSVEDIDRAPPIVHSKCTVIKAHGDYLDTRTLNTGTELAVYDAKLASYLSRVFSDFGLLVLGWSATWDQALRQAIATTQAPFSTYWATRGEPAPEAVALMETRKAHRIEIDDSEVFLPALKTKLDALQALAGSRDLSEAMLVAAVKRLITNEQDRIQLQDKTTEEQRRVLDYTLSLPLHPGLPNQSFLDRATDLATRSTRVLSVLGTIAFWAESRHATLLVESLERFANLPRPITTWNDYLEHLRRLPGSLALFTIGTVAVARDNYQLLARILLGPRPTADGKDVPGALSPHMVMPRLTVPGPTANTETRILPSRFVAERVDQSLAEILSDPDRRNASFHRFEVLYGLHLLHKSLPRSNFTYFPSTPWRQAMSGREALDVVKEEIATQGTEWPPLKAGLYDGNLAKLQVTLTAYEALVAQRGPFDRW